MASADKKIRVMLSLVIAIVVTGVMLGYVMPIGMDAMYEANTTGWGDAETELFDILPIFIILAVLMVIIGWVVMSYGKR